MVVPGGTRGWLGRAFPAWAQHDPTTHAPLVLGSPPVLGSGNPAATPACCGWMVPGSRSPRYSWFGLRSQLHLVEMETEVPSLIPGGNPHPCPTGSAGAEPMPGEPEKAPVSSLGTAVFPPFKAVKFHSSKNTFFTHCDGDSRGLSLSGAQTGRVLTSSAPSLGSPPTGGHTWAIQKPLPQFHIAPGQCHGLPQLSRVAAEQQLGWSCLKASAEICKAEPPPVIFISSAPALVSWRDLLLCSAVKTANSTGRFISLSIELNGHGGLGKEVVQLATIRMGKEGLYCSHINWRKMPGINTAFLEKPLQYFPITVPSRGLFTVR